MNSRVVPTKPPTFRRSAAYGLASAALFGVSAPIGKLLLPHIPPLSLAALLYLGAGAGVTFVGWSPQWRHSRSALQPLRRSNLKLMVVSEDGRLLLSMRRRFSPKPHVVGRLVAVFGRINPRSSARQPE